MTLYTHMLVSKIGVATLLVPSPGPSTLRASFGFQRDCIVPSSGFCEVKWRMKNYLQSGVSTLSRDRRGKSRWEIP